MVSQDSAHSKRVATTAAAPQQLTVLDSVQQQAAWEAGAHLRGRALPQLQ